MKTPDLSQTIASTSLKHGEKRYSWECQKCGDSGESDEIVGSPCGGPYTNDSDEESECDGQIICIEQTTGKPANIRARLGDQ